MAADETGLMTCNPIDSEMLKLNPILSGCAQFIAVGERFGLDA